jgi:uncharacterized delta-60 repeat protein
MKHSLLVLLLGASQIIFGQAGLLDPTFGTNGIASTPFGISVSEAMASAVQSDGKIVATGLYSSGGTGKVAFTRYNSNGMLDATFGTNGKVQINTSGESVMKAVHILSNGSIIAGGTFAAKPLLVRLTNTGALDPSFGTSGQVTFDGGLNGINDIKIDGNGKIVGCGRLTTAPSSLVVFRRNADGSVDNTFGTAGFAMVPTGGGLSTATRVVMQGAKIIVTGYFFSMAGSYNSMTARLNANGTLDATFGTAGKTESAFSSGYEYAENIALTPDNKIILSGRLANVTPNVKSLVWRLTENGMPDNTFGTNGNASFAAGVTADDCKALAVQSDGKILLAGFTLVGTSKQGYIMRLNKNGTLDTSFGTSGITTTVSGANTGGYTLRIQNDNKILMSGFSTPSSTQIFSVLRYQSGSVVGANEPESSLVSAQAYPNPVTSGDVLTYKLALTASDIAQVSLFTQDGRLVSILKVNEKLSLGANQLELNLPSALAAGQYFITVKGETFTDTKAIQIGQ